MNEQPQQLPPENLFRRRLVISGLLTEIKTPSSVLPLADRTPIQVEGKPLSQAILEEWR
jgi:hypothetical protein